MATTTQTITVQIQCINKKPRTDPFDRIKSIGGVHNAKRWKLSLDDAIKGIESKKYSFFVRGANAARVAVVVAVAPSGRKYLKTSADSSTSNNLLSLPECP